MGGKNPLVVLADANLDLAVDLAVKGGIRPDRAGLYRHQPGGGRRIRGRCFCGCPDQSRPQPGGWQWPAKRGAVGPAVNRAQLETDHKYMALGQTEGAKLAAGGEVDERAGYFAQATVFDHVEPTMRIAQEEIFGPVISVLRARDLDDAIQKANSISFGLSAGVVTNDLQKAFAFANRIEAGVVKINEPTTGLALNAPFGGFKQSSANTFKEQGQAAMDFYTRTKTIYVGHGG